MASSFSIHPAQLSATSSTALHDAVRSHTGCDEETASILGCIERLGTDPTICRYEVTRIEPRAFARPTRINWTVRAVRP